MGPANHPLWISTWFLEQLGIKERCSHASEGTRDISIMYTAVGMA